MSKSQAAATGLFNTDVDHGPDDCRGVSPLGVEVVRRSAASTCS